jgi:hypothetical protein
MALTPDHDLVAAPFADGHVAAVLASISPIVVIVATIIATFALAAAVGPDTDVQLSQRDPGLGGESTTSAFGGCRKNPDHARDGGDKCHPSHFDLLVW